MSELSRFFDDEWVVFWTIPVFTAVVGWLINWTGLIMLFNPVRLHGLRVSGLAELARLAPHKVQEIPGLLHGVVGWQGIVPGRAAKMGSIAVDKVIAKIPVGRLGESDEVARVVEFLADPDASFITGQIYSVNGGQYM